MTQVEAESAIPQLETEGGDAVTGIAGAATVIALGNVSSRILGLVREMVIAYLFGATGLVSAFDVAARVPRMMFDLLIDGMVSSALVPLTVQTQRLAPSRLAYFSSNCETVLPRPRNQLPLRRIDRTGFSADLSQTGHSGHSAVRIGSPPLTAN